MKVLGLAATRCLASPYGSPASRLRPSDGALGLLATPARTQRSGWSANLNNVSVGVFGLVATLSWTAQLGSSAKSTSVYQAVWGFARHRGSHVRFVVPGEHRQCFGWSARVPSRPGSDLRFGMGGQVSKFLRGGGRVGRLAECFFVHCDVPASVRLPGRATRMVADSWE